MRVKVTHAPEIRLSDSKISRQYTSDVSASRPYNEKANQLQRHDIGLAELSSV